MVLEDYQSVSSLSKHVILYVERRSALGTPFFSSPVDHRQQFISIHKYVDLEAFASKGVY